jgi:methyl-accepting chemotaxis protein
VSLRAKILVSLVGLLVIVGTLVVGAIRLGNAQEENAARVSRSLTDRMAPARELAALAKDIRYHVVQVQQFITDASATGELGDDEKAAAEHAATFTRNAARAAIVARTLGDAAAADLVARMQAAFPGYYDTGGRMAHAYVDHGVAAGNVLMKQFDLDAEALSDLTTKLDDLASRAADDSARYVQSEAEAQEALARSVYQASVVAGSLLSLLCAAAGAMLLYGVVRPLTRLSEATRRVGAGEVVGGIPGAQRRDELGTMATALARWQQAIGQAAEVTAKAETAKTEAEAQKHAALIGMAERIEAETTATLEEVNRNTTAMAETASEMQASAGRTDVSARQAADAAGQALANAQTVASAAEQLSGSIREIGGQATQSTAVVARAVAAGAETRKTIEALNARVEQIGAVADIIGEIATRTNLLALNATIEAARAGDAGKGFAVVASEVKALATQTASSTQEISRHIGDVRAATLASVNAVTLIEQTIDEVNAIAGSIAAAVEQQGAATAEIARNVAGTAAAANEMTSRVTEVSAEAGQTGRRAAEVRDSTTEMKQAVEQLKHQVVRMVRTSTDEVNRRQMIRFATALPCRLSTSAQGTRTARITDLSQSGARVEGGPQLTAGQRGTLAADGIDFPLPFIVRSADDDALHLGFELDAGTAARFRQVPERLGRGLAA